MSGKKKNVLPENPSGKAVFRTRKSGKKSAVLKDKVVNTQRNHSKP